MLRLVDENDPVGRERAAEEMLRKIAPELLADEVADSLPSLVQALLDGTENDGVLPPVPEVPPDAPATEVAAQQMVLLRHALRSAILSQYVRSALAPGAAPGVVDS